VGLTQPDPTLPAVWLHIESGRTVTPAHAICGFGHPIKNTDPVFGGFAGEFIRGGAQMEWTAKVGDFMFVSDPISTSSSSFAEIGHERNGSFFP
jgi:hypothetical protein